MRKKSIIAIGVSLVVLFTWMFDFPGGNSRARAEREHGISIPSSANHIQCRGDAWLPFLDRGATTMFEMSAKDLSAFVAQLPVDSRSAPSLRTGDPAVNGWNVWPIGSATFVPANRPYGGFRHTWRGNAVPIEMLSCSSPKGDWLHVELWNVQDGSVLVKMHTDWN